MQSGLNRGLQDLLFCHIPMIRVNPSHFAPLWDPMSKKAMAPHSSVHAWRIPGMGEPGGLQSMGSHRVGHD